MVDISKIEAQLQATLNVIPAYTWYALPSGALTFVNERTADYLGLPKDHPLRFGMDTGREWDSHIAFLHPDDHGEPRRLWSTCLRTGCAGEVTLRVRNAEGGYRWFLCRVEPLRASDGTLFYWVGINLDIEERKSAEEEIRAQEIELRQILDLVPQLIAVYGPNRERLYANQVFLDYVGCSLEAWRQSLGRGRSLHPDDVEPIGVFFDQAVARGSAGELELRLRKRVTGELLFRP